MGGGKGIDTGLVWRSLGTTLPTAFSRVQALTCVTTCRGGPGRLMDEAFLLTKGVSDHLLLPGHTPIAHDLLWYKSCTEVRIAGRSSLGMQCKRDNPIHYDRWTILRMHTTKITYMHHRERRRTSEAALSICRPSPIYSC